MVVERPFEGKDGGREVSDGSQRHEIGRGDTVSPDALSSVSGPNGEVHRGKFPKDKLDITFFFFF
ncbi:MAG: hypothetical protein D6808_05670 [Candidatus Dadabacteria bacterium]|nr:MAG: hypothetical protein D6808_05670 [Candidatus Dadabacteria bacterium]